MVGCKSVSSCKTSFVLPVMESEFDSKDLECGMFLTYQGYRIPSPVGHPQSNAASAFGEDLKKSEDKTWRQSKN